MKLCRIFGLVMWLAALAAGHASADPHAPGFGPIRFGMTFDQIRAATPGAEWTAQGDAQLRTKAVKIAGETFAATVSDLTWDNYSLTANASIETGSAEDCSAHHAKFIEFLETEYGSLAPLKPKAMPGWRILPTPPQPGVTITIVAVGKSSQAELWRQEREAGAWGSSLAAQFETPTLRVELRAGASESLPPNKPHLCELKLNVETTIPRPPQGTVARDDLVLENAVSIGAAHHSLDRAPAVPAQGLDVDLDCVVSDRDLRLEQCKASNDDANVAPFVAAAQYRALHLTAARRSKSGKWTIGERAGLRVHFAPGDRRTLPALDFSRSALLHIETHASRAPIYPQRALDRAVSAKLELSCVVQSDGSLICPDIASDADDYKDEFIASALRFELSKRYGLRLSNGEPSAGVALRDVVTFKVQR